METTHTLEFYTVAQIRDAFNAQGSYWFSPDTMKFFGTSFPKGGEVFGGRYFVSREDGRASFSENLFLVREVVAHCPAEGRLPQYDIRTHHKKGKDGFRTYDDARDYILGLIGE